MLIVIGGDAAGMSAASQVRRLQPETGHNRFLSAVPIHRFRPEAFPITSPVWSTGKTQLIARTPQAFREKYNINVHTRHEVTAVDPENQKVLVKNLHSSTEHWQHYDQLLVRHRGKTGSTAPGGYRQPKYLRCQQPGERFTAQTGPCRATAEDRGDCRRRVYRPGDGRGTPYAWPENHHGPA